MSPSGAARVETEADPADRIALRETGLKKSLTRAQVVMIGLGGAIGTGLFAGSSLAIGYAGPAVLISYVIAGFAALVMVFSLSEMAVAHPAAGSFGVYAQTYLNPWAGFIVRYTYWMAQVVAIGGEAVAVGVYMSFWFPDAPVWIWSVGFALVLLLVNSRSVKNFGTIEYWFALIKVTAIVAFILLGLVEVLGLGRRPIGLHNLTGLPGGFMPHGVKGVWMAVIMGVFSYNGIEVIAVTSGETADPARTIPAALRTMALRLFLFYILALAVVVAVVPWTQVGAVTFAESPFVKVFAQSGVRQAAGLMNFVVITAALSSMNTNIYLCSRMLFSLSRGGYAPRFVGGLSRAGTPIAAILLSGAGILIAAAVAELTPKAYSYLFGIALFGAIVVWIIILASHLAFRRRHQARALTVRTPGFPALQIAGIALLSAVLVTMGLDKDWWLSWIVGVPWLALLTVAYFVWKRRPRSGEGARMTSSERSIEPAAILASHRRRLRSERIGETFQIDVALPSVQITKGPLPVVYLVNGNTVFGIAAQALRQMRGSGETRPALVVGIGYCLDGIQRPRNALGDLRTRDLTPTHDQSYLDRMSRSRQGGPPPVSIRPSGGADDFLDFLVEDLRPFIAGLYDTDPRDQILVGSSLGGLFTLHVMLTRPGAFLRYVANSPSLYWDNRRLMGHLDGFEQRLGDTEIEVFLSAGSLEHDAPQVFAATMSEFADALRGMSAPNMRVTSHVFEGETHTSVIPAALSRGLRTVLRMTGR